MAWVGSRESRGYDWVWRKKRQRVLARDDYLCQPCLKAGRPTPATEVDHIVGKAIAVKRGWSTAQTEDEANLQSICSPCHKQKTLVEKGVRIRRRIGADGYPIEEETR